MAIKDFILKVKHIHFPLLYKGLLLFAILLGINSFSQNIIVKAKLDNSSIKIGEQTQLNLSIQYRADNGDVKVSWPTITDTIIKQIEIVGKTKIDTIIPDKADPYNFIQNQTLTITSFDSGYYAIPPFRFIINGDSNNVRETEAILFQVQTFQIDTTRAIKDIKPPYEAPFDFRELIPYLAWGALILAIIIIIIYLFKRYMKKKPAPVIEAIPELPPHILALEALEKLRAEKLWQEGKIKIYYSSITEIIRLYIERRYKIDTLEQTTDEILKSFQRIETDKEIKTKLKHLLIMADLVKFAKEQPLPNENEMSLNNAVDFVNATKEIIDENIMPEKETNNNIG